MFGYLMHREIGRSNPEEETIKNVNGMNALVLHGFLSKADNNDAHYTRVPLFT